MLTLLRSRECFGFGRTIAVIDIKSEQLVSLREVPKLLPARGNGRRIHVSAIYRWVQRGVRGTRLEVIRVGGTTYTSREALQRFASPTAPFSQAGTDMASSRQKQIDRAVEQLDELLYARKVRRRGNSRLTRGQNDRGTRKS
jgi:hypothetical protein